MRRRLTLIATVLALVAAGALATPAESRDRPFSTSRLTVRPEIGPLTGGNVTGGTGNFSEVAIEAYRCAVAAGPA